MAKVTLSPNQIHIDGKPFELICGDIHYFRIYPGGLRRRLELMKAFGLTAVQTYVPWNLHEPKKGEFCFNGLCDLEGFLALCAELELKVLLRPSPYICSEWELGGLPPWLLREGVALRTSDPRYLAHISDYYQALIPRFLPYLASNGGPIIAVALENEYGSFGNDRAYLEALRDLLLKGGIDVPLYTTDGHEMTDLFYGTLPDVWAGVNYRIESREAISRLRSRQKNKPALIGEYWSGRAIHWGEPYEKRNVSEVAEGFRAALECGGLPTFYMFAGGTNFGFMNGANYGLSFSTPKGTPPRYIPHTTTYDEDALLNEQGLPTKKYFACRKVLWQHRGLPEPPMPDYARPVQELPPIPLSKSASLFQWAEQLKAVESERPLSMEALGQDYGYILYQTTLTGCGLPLQLSITELRDRADIWVDQKYAGALMRDRAPASVSLNIPKGKTAKISILCENMGRINYGPKLGEKKGILGSVIVAARHQVQLFGWKNIPLPFENIDAPFEDFIPAKTPLLLRGCFRAEPGIDTFLDLRNFKKGFVIVNGFHLGRYWSIGPQKTLYLPGELLKEENTIEIFEHYGATAPKLIKTRKTPVLK